MAITSPSRWWNAVSCRRSLGANLVLKSDAVALEFRPCRAALLVLMIKRKPDVIVIISGRKQTRSGLGSRNRHVGILFSKILAKSAQNIDIERLLADDTIDDIALDDLANELIVRKVVIIVDGNRDLEANVELVVQVETIKPTSPIVRLPALRQCNLRRRLIKMLLPSNPKNPTYKNQCLPL